MKAHHRFIFRTFCPVFAQKLGGSTAKKREAFAQEEDLY
jgi:hypothetical protein